MNNLSSQSQKTLARLREKTADRNVRFPSINSIHALLSELEIMHDFRGETQNVVERRSAGNRYVNSRHNGKIGKMIRLRAKGNNDSIYLEMDSSSSYYSWNTWGYALDLIKIIDNKHLFTFDYR